MYCITTIIYHSGPEEAKEIRKKTLTVIIIYLSINKWGGHSHAVQTYDIVSAYSNLINLMYIILCLNKT